MISLTQSQILFTRIYLIFLLLQTVSDIVVSESQSKPKSQRRTFTEIINTKVLNQVYPVSLKNKVFKQVQLKLYESDVSKVESLYEGVDKIELINAFKQIFFDLNIMDYKDFLDSQINKHENKDALKKLQLRFTNYQKSIYLNMDACQMVSRNGSSFIINIDGFFDGSNKLLNITFQKNNRFCQDVIKYTLGLFPLEFLYCELINEVNSIQISNDSFEDITENYNRQKFKNKENQSLDNVYTKGISHNEYDSSLYPIDSIYKKTAVDDEVNAECDPSNFTSINYCVDTTGNSLSTTKSFTGNNITDTILVNSDFFVQKFAKYNLFEDIASACNYEEKIQIIVKLTKILTRFKKFDNLYMNDTFTLKMNFLFNSLFNLYHSVYADFLQRLIIKKTTENLPVIHTSYTQLKVFLTNIDFCYDERWEYIFETLNVTEFEKYFQRNLSTYFKDPMFEITDFISDLEGIQDVLEELDPRYDFIKNNFNTTFKNNFSRSYRDMIRKFKKRARVKKFKAFKIFQYFILNNVKRFNLSSSFDENKNFNSHFLKFYKNFVLYLSDQFFRATKNVYHNKEADDEFLSIKRLDVLKLGRALGEELQSLFDTKSGVIYTNVMVHFTRNISRDLLDLLFDMRNDFVLSLISINRGKQGENSYKKLFLLLKDTCNIIVFINEFKKVFVETSKKGSKLTNNRIQYFDLESILELNDVENYRIEIEGKILYSNETLFMHTYDANEDLMVEIFHKDKSLFKIPITDVSKDGRVQIELKKRKILLNLKFRKVVIEDFSISYYAEMVVKCGSLLCKFMSKEIVKLEFDNLENKQLLKKLEDTGVVKTIKGLESDYFYNVLWRHYCEKTHACVDDTDTKVSNINELFLMLQEVVDDKNVLDKDNVYYDYILKSVELTKSTKKSEIIIYYEKENLMHQGEIKVKTELADDAMRKLKKKVI